MTSLISNPFAQNRSFELPAPGSKFLRLPAFLIAYCMLYFLAAKVGIATKLPPEGIVIIWPANAIVLVTLLSAARKNWWLFFLATVATEIASDIPDYPLWAAAGYGVVNFLEAAFAATLLQAFQRGAPGLRGLRDFLVFLAAGPLVGSGSAALIGAAIYKLGSPGLDYIHYWRVFWFGDALGLLIIGTALLGWRSPHVWQSSPRWQSVLEGTALTLSWAVAASWVFTEPDTPHLYLIFPFLMWGALRFGIAGASGVVLATVTVAIWSAVSNAGPFTGLSHIDTVVSLQGLILVVAISTFMLAFSIEDLRRTERNLVREVEQRKTAEDEVRQINHRLEQSNRSLDQVIANRTDELRKSLMRNEILLKELKHRVKNNLQIVSGLIGLQSRSLSDQNSKDRLVRLQAQIGAIAATYELLHRTQGQETVDLGKLIPALCHNLEGSHGESISISVSVIGCAPVSADTSVALSLALNELITNSIKHATGRVSIAVTCIRNCEKIELRVADNGPGFPPGFDINEAQSFGLRVAGALIMQANGEWRLSSNEGGATIEIVVPAAREPDRETGL